jgi:hypothetical protein
MSYDTWKTTPPEDNGRTEPDEEPDEERLQAHRDRLAEERQEVEIDAPNGVVFVRLTHYDKMKEVLDVSGPYPIPIGGTLTLSPLQFGIVVESKVMAPQHLWTEGAIEIAFDAVGDAP